MKRGFVLFFGLALSAACLLASALFYDRLPDATPVHWGLLGRADGFMPKPFGPFFYPLLLAAISLGASVLPIISPAKFRIGPFASSYRLIVGALLAAIAWTDASVVAAGLGLPLDPGRAVFLGLGLTLAAVGNVLGKVTPNFFVGIRTPWTLASPEVWRRTHRLAGWVFVAAGGVMALAAALGAPPAAPLLALLAAALWLVVYSYLLYRRIGPRESDSHER